LLNKARKVNGKQTINEGSLGGAPVHTHKVIDGRRHIESTAKARSARNPRIFRRREYPFLVAHGNLE
jgi:hypothetical protein